jgi:hypothetical protein
MDHAYESPEGILYMIYDGIFIRGEFYNETSDVNELMSFDFKSKVIYSGSTVEGVTSWFLGSEGESVSFYYGVIDADNGSRYRVIDGNDYSVVYFYSDLPELTDYTTAWEPYKISDFTFSGDPSLLPEPGANDYSDDVDWRINDLVIENAVDPSDFWWWKFTDWFNRYGWIVFSSIAGGLIIVVSGLGFVLKGRR